MIVHTLRFRFRDEATEAERAAALTALRQVAAMDSVRYGTVGQCLGDPAAGYTHACTFGIEDLAALERYMNDPVHLAADPRIAPHLAKLAIGPDLSDDPDPELGAKLLAMHEAKLRKYPDWAELMSTIPEVTVA
ncbi:MULTISPECIES: Dabb family protein [unclassified Nocardia]|uniref:Dabb family protein n=1 Tax=unclassified Nocardia TaxID=2637762 RepID=UPI001CE3E409|nr:MULTISPECIES: Dabb family protein [unclassified Nocardia]